VTINEDEDPIEKSINERKKAGGITEVVAAKKGTASSGKTTTKPTTT